MIFCYLLSLFIQFLLVRNDELSNTYNIRDKVMMWYDSIGPIDTINENYKVDGFYNCHGAKHDTEHYHETLGESILGYEPTFSGLEILFLVDHPITKYCEKSYSTHEIGEINKAILKKYYLKISIDGVQITVPFGVFVDNLPHLYLNTIISLGYNKKRITAIKIKKDQPVILKENNSYVFNYLVNWYVSKIKFEDRLQYIDGYVTFDSRAHLFSIFNSFMMVFFLIFTVTIIMVRLLKKDFIFYKEYDIMNEKSYLKEFGWKLIYADVFRRPRHFLILCSFVGCGIHLLFTFGAVFLSACIFDIHKTRGMLLTFFIFTYTCLSPINGYVGGSIFAKYGGRRWVLQNLFSILLVPIILCKIPLIIKIFSVLKGNSTYVESSAFLTLICILFFVCIPLTFIGSIVGRYTIGKNTFPCRISNIPRPIRTNRMFHNLILIHIFGGILPFGSIFIETYFIFTTIWTYKFFVLYQFLALVFFIMISISSCVSIVISYILLNNEDYRWQWNSFISGASVSYYLLGYSIYFYYNKLNISGAFQHFFYLFFSVLGSFSTGLICGASSFLASNIFVNKIYSTIKFD